MEMMHCWLYRSNATGIVEFASVLGDIVIGV
jgi:hypothetical protein